MAASTKHLLMPKAKPAPRLLPLPGLCLAHTSLPTILLKTPSTVSGCPVHGDINLARRADACCLCERSRSCFTACETGGPPTEVAAGLPQALLSKAPFAALLRFFCLTNGVMSEMRGMTFWSHEKDKNKASSVSHKLSKASKGCQ